MLTLIVAFLLRWSPEFTETVYRNTWFAAFRWLIDTTLAWLPFPVFWLVFAGVFAIFFRGWMRRSLFMYRPWYRGIANAIGWLLIAFYFMWGFNYSAPGFADKAGLVIDRSNTEFRDALWQRAVQEALAARSEADTAEFFLNTPTHDFLEDIHSEVRAVLRNVGFKTPGNPRMRLISGGALRRMGISGIYFPFSGECHTDASHLPVRRYPIIAHEYAHAYGVTDEGECNLIGFLALAQSRNPALRYAAWLDLIVSLWMRIDELPTALKGDIEVLRADAMNYPPFLPGTAEFTNNLYLKANGVNEGIDSYASTPLLIHSALGQGWLSPEP